MILWVYPILISFPPILVWLSHYHRHMKLKFSKWSQFGPRISNVTQIWAKTGSELAALLFWKHLASLQYLSTILECAIAPIQSLTREVEDIKLYPNPPSIIGLNPTVFLLAKYCQWILFQNVGIKAPPMNFPVLRLDPNYDTLHLIKCLQWGDLIWLKAFNNV